MASKLTDEQKAAMVLGDVERPEGTDETTESEDVTEEPEEELEDTEELAEDESDEEKPSEEEVETKEPEESSFTKQFSNLKGESWEEYGPELEKAYDNSFKEALRLNDLIKEKDKQLTDNAAIIEQARQIVAQTGQPQAGQENPNPTVAEFPTTQASPEVEWIKDFRRQNLMSAFDQFKADYPQVLDQAEFERFRIATDGVATSLAATLGHQPTDLEVFKATANMFGWQPIKPQQQKQAKIKENASSSRDKGSQSAALPKKSVVSDAEVEMHLKLFPLKTREQAIKDLSEVKV